MTSSVRWHIRAANSVPYLETVLAVGKKKKEKRRIIFHVLSFGVEYNSILEHDYKN